jgi:hypothetical protein
MTKKPAKRRAKFHQIPCAGEPPASSDGDALERLGCRVPLFLISGSNCAYATSDRGQSARHLCPSSSIKHPNHGLGMPSRAFRRRNSAIGQFCRHLAG